MEDGGSSLSTCCSPKLCKEEQMLLLLSPEGTFQGISEDGKSCSQTCVFLGFELFKESKAGSSALP